VLGLRQCEFIMKGMSRMSPLYECYQIFFFMLAEMITYYSSGEEEIENSMESIDRAEIHYLKVSQLMRAWQEKDQSANDRDDLLELHYSLEEAYALCEERRGDLLDLKRHMAEEEDYILNFDPEKERY
jgi:hypothetical protein